MDEGCAGAAVGLAGQRKGDDIGVPAEEGVHGLAELSDALAVDEAHLEDSCAAAFGEVFEYDFLHVGGAEGMKVQHAINGNAEWFIHNSKCAGLRPRQNSEAGRKPSLLTRCVS